MLWLTLCSLQTMEAEMVTKVIMGDSIDLFDQFVKNWYDTGGEDITKEVNEWAVNKP